MIYFFDAIDLVYAVVASHALESADKQKLSWLFNGSPNQFQDQVTGSFIGPRANMITPWSTNATEITMNMGIKNIERIEKFRRVHKEEKHDPMLEAPYAQLDRDIFVIDVETKPIIPIQNIGKYNEDEGLSLSADEVDYLESLARKLGRPLTDSEVFGFSQVNSEHCRHKIFNGTFVIDGVEKEHSLFRLIKETSKKNPNSIVSAYKDNVAFTEGPSYTQFGPRHPFEPSDYDENEYQAVLSLKAETHNFPTTVEPFNGAATGSGGEIRDRLGGGIGSLPLAGTAVYMTSYPRHTDGRTYENNIDERPWLYQTPLDILIKASNGASDFGNKFGQPLIAGSLLTFEHQENDSITAYDKVIMLAGGIGYTKKEQALKRTPKKGDIVVVLGGDNYRIGMGGAAVSSADTGEFGAGLELNAVQRSNPEMQKRVANLIRALVESEHNPIISIHDHGAGGHLNCLSELVEETGGKINITQLPIGDPTLSYKEIIGNESQERMGLVISAEDLPLLRHIAERERAPLYVVGEVTGAHDFVFENPKTGEKPVDLALIDLFGSSPRTIMRDNSQQQEYEELKINAIEIDKILDQVLRLDSVACKDWLVNKVDRCVGGLVANQQTVGELQLPLSNCGVMALDFNGKNGIATSIGHAPKVSLIDPAKGSRNAIAEALTNIIWAPLADGLKSVSLSANWMWPCNNPGEDARLYNAVQATSEFACELGINIPTGKDSLSMAQKYEDKTVLAPGTVIISASGHCSDIRRVVLPVLRNNAENIYYLDLSLDKKHLGGSSLAQVMNLIGNKAPTVVNTEAFKNGFEVMQEMIVKGKISSGHDLSDGGLVIALLEMCFPSLNIGADIHLTEVADYSLVEVLFSENPGIIFQCSPHTANEITGRGISLMNIGHANTSNTLNITLGNETIRIDIPSSREKWYSTSHAFEKHQSPEKLADARFKNYVSQPLKYHFPEHFSGRIKFQGERAIQAAILREQGSNSEREMANALYKAGFKVRDVHMSDLISGQETLEDVHFLGAVGGFSNSDVLGSAKGWAGSIKYNKKARHAIEQFFAREDTLSIGICNGCQLFLELDLINPEHDQPSRMKHNESGKHECSFTSVSIPRNNSVMFNSLEGARLGVWISHGEGKFSLPKDRNDYHIVGEYVYSEYPANPNGSDYNCAMLASMDGRHLATMPHIERSFHSWNWAFYPEDREDEVSPWAIAFENAREWLEKKLK